MRFDTAHLHWPSWADAQLDPRTGKVWPGMAGAGRRRVSFLTMLVASIDTDRPPEGPPASTQACSRQRRATGSTTIHRQSNNTTAFLPVCGMTNRWGSSCQTQHNVILFRRGAPVLWGLAVPADRSPLEIPPAACRQKHIADRKTSALQAPGHCGH